MNQIIKKEFNGVEIAFHGKKEINLTDLWKASGASKENRPSDWVNLPNTLKFIDELAQKLNTEKSGILKTTRGKGGGTWGHWQIALEYARYLSPEIAIWTNQVVKERLEEERNPELALTRGQERAIRGWKRQGKTDEWISRRLRAIDATKIDNRVLAKHGDDNLVFPMCADALNQGVIGMKAKEFKEANNLPAHAPTRDHLTDIQLAEITLASLVSCQRITENNVRGNDLCANVHRVIAERVSNAVNMRGV